MPGVKFPFIRLFERRLVRESKYKSFYAIEVFSPDRKEADISTGQPVGILAPKKKKQESLKSTIVKAKFLERDSKSSPSKFSVILIEEGMGNMKDCFFYTAECLKQACKVFEGKKCYADHPSSIDEESRPERSIRDVVGHFQNCHVEEGDEGQSLLCGELVIMDDPSFDWARSMVEHAVDYSSKYDDKQFIGLSINASGDAAPIAIEDLISGGNIPESAIPKLKSAQAEGVEEVRLVSNIVDATSCDLVTEAGAKGRIVKKL